MILLRDVHKRFGSQVVLDGVDLDVQEGETLALLGPSGTGKSVLLKHIIGLIRPDSGIVVVDDEDVGKLRRKELAALRSRIGYVFQNGALFDSMSVFENVRCAVLWSLGYGYAFWRSVDRGRQVRERAETVLEQLNPTARRDVPAGVLSYAEQRALEIGITIAGGADVILLDEPTSGMSRSETEQVVQLIRQVTAGRTLLMVEHDMSVVFDLADRIAVLVYGQIIAHDTPERIRASAAVQEAYLGVAAPARC